METYPGLIWSAEFDFDTIRLTRHRGDMTQEQIIALTDRLNAEELNRRYAHLDIEFIEPLKVPRHLTEKS